MSVLMQLSCVYCKSSAVYCRFWFWKRTLRHGYNSVISAWGISNYQRKFPFLNHKNHLTYLSSTVLSLTEYFWSVSFNFLTSSSHRWLSTFLSSINWSINVKWRCIVPSYSFLCMASCCLCSLLISCMCVAVKLRCSCCMKNSKVINILHVAVKATVQI